MSTKLFVAGLAFSINDDQLKDVFSPHGTVQSAQVIIDRDTGRSKGFGFVEMSSPEEAQTAIRELDGKEVEGRTIVVNEARPQERREPRSFGGGGQGGGQRNGGDRRRGGGSQGGGGRRY